MSDYFTTADFLSFGNASFPLFGKANIWVEDTVVDSSSLQFCQSVIDAALRRTCPGQLEITVFDDALTGIGAPFDALNTGGVKLFHTINSKQEFKSTLLQLKDYVQGVNNLMKGRASDLVEYRRLVKFPVEAYKLIVVSTDIALLDSETQNLLSVLLRAAPRSGVSFLIHSVTAGVEFLANFCVKMKIPNFNLTVEGRSFGYIGAPPSPDELIKTSELIGASLSRAATPTIDFPQIQDLNSLWSEDSAEGLTFSIGRYGDSIVSITLGDKLNQRHNILITGAVGQGKTNLLSVMLHSLCQRYSPSQLQLYLLDLKEGVTLQAFADETTGEYLPHVKVLGLEADREFSLRVLQSLFAEYKQRMAEFKRSGVQNLREYRIKYPQKSMARILLAIDEYQLLFADNDRLASEIAELLIRSVRLFRAAGIHVVLASQTIGGNMALMGSGGEGLFGQIPIRLALKNSLSESYATLGSNNPAAAFLRPREVIVNEDYGALSSNKKAGVAWANESVLSALRHQWWLARSPESQPPYVFRGDRVLSFAEHQRYVRNQEGTYKSIPDGTCALLGDALDVTTVPICAPLTRDIGRNIAMIGVGDVIPELCAAVASAALTSGAEGCEVWVIDAGTAAGAAGGGRAQALQEFYNLMTNASIPVRIIGKDEANTVFDELASAQVRLEKSRLLVMGIGMERLRDMPLSFQDVCKYGPANGIHIIGWWGKYDALKQQVGFGGESSFDVRIAFRVDPQSAKTIFDDPLIDWRGGENRAMVWDSAYMTQPQLLIPYTSIFASEDAGKDLG